MLQRLLTVATNTFTETIRQPIYGVILLATTLMLVLNVSLAAFTLEDDNKLLLDLGLSTLLLGGLFLSAFSATGIMAREIENKTVLTVLSKPITRYLFVVGKFVGLFAALALAFYLSFLIFLLAERHGVMERTSDPWDGPVITFGIGALALSILLAAFRNYFYGKDFRTTAIAIVTPLLTVAVILVGFFDEHWDPIPFGSNFIGGQVILAAYLVFLIVAITAAVALAASTRLGQMMTLLVCTVVLGLGIVSDYAVGQYANQSRLAAVAYATIPNAGVFWVIDGLQAESAETAISLAYLGYATGYALLITTGVVALAVALFQRREVG